MGDGSLWAVLADATSGTDSYRFRFLRPPPPEEGPKPPRTARQQGFRDGGLRC
ncbi:hypothetical protein ACH4OG_16310 [Streptomyces lydicus]|uniref:hypothetical protein n=1 Tax=Streptomyces lydicus TaxID=47763 RepID=UPI0037AC20C3